MNVIVLRRKMNMNYSELLQLAKGWSNFNYVKFMIFFIFQYFLKKLDIQLLYKYNNIIYYLNDEDTNAGYMYLKRRKNNGYSFEERKLSQNVDDKLEEILEYEQGWNIIKDEYLKIKNRNRDPHKKSFILYLESIHNVYNHINQYKEKERLRRAFIPLNSWYGFIR